MTERVAPVCADERIEVVRVKLTCAGGSAVVSELRAADLLLARWLENGAGSPALSFEVTFVDGYAFRGCYAHDGRRKGKPSVSRFVRSVFKGLRTLPGAPPDGVQFLSMPSADLTRYAIDGH